jgi:hypothetical protein
MHNQPGTYDALSHMHFQPLPTTGSSGGPIVDENTGAVVGVMLGTRMDSSIEGVRGWGVPAETIFEVRPRTRGSTFRALLTNLGFRCSVFRVLRSGHEMVGVGVHIVSIVC